MRSTCHCQKREAECVTAVDNFISLIRFLACSWPNLFLVAAKRGFKPDFLLCVMSHTQIKRSRRATLLGKVT